MEKYKIKNLIHKMEDEKRSTLCCLLVKNIARKTIPKTETYIKYGFVITEHECQHCPRCNHILNAGPNYQPKCCSQCGQKLNFSGTRWKEDKELGFAKRGEAYESV